MKSKLFKRITAAALALLMVGASVPSDCDFSQFFTGSEIVASAQTSSSECGENAVWEFDRKTGKLTISGTGAIYDYNGTDMPWYENRHDITAIEIGSGITVIGDAAFANSSNAKSVTIPSSVTTISDGAFAECGFSSIDIPSTVTSIGPDAFYGSKLINVTIPGGVTVINENVFRGCELLESVVIPQGVTSIGESAFAGCESLKTVVIPSTVTYICYSAFDGCEAVDDVFLQVDDPTDLEWGTGENDFKPEMETKCHVPSGTAEAYRSKFDEYTYNITFVDDIEEIKCGDNAYWTMTDTDDDETPDKLTISGKGEMFDYEYYGDDDIVSTPWNDYRYDIKSIEISSNITKIGNYAFAGLQNVSSVTFGKNSLLDNIGESAFWKNYSIESITIPKSVETLEASVFDTCVNLKKVIFEDGSKLEKIDYMAFVFCQSLQNITIPAPVKTIGGYAFNGCGSLEKVLFEDGTLLEAIDEYAFYGCFRLNGIYIPATVTTIGADAFYGCSGM